MPGVFHDQAAADLSSAFIDYTFPTDTQPSNFSTDVMEMYPGISVSGAIKMGRGTNTITRGGWADTPYSAGPASRGKRWFGKGAPKQGIYAGGTAHLYHKPRNWTRVAHQDYFHMPYQQGKYKYNPFYASSIPNFFSRALTGHAPDGSIRQRVLGGKRSAQAGKGLMGRGIADEHTGDILSRGWTSRVNASSRIMRMTDSQFVGSGTSGRVNRFITGAHRANLASAGIEASTAIPNLTRVQSSQAILGTMRGVSGIAGGYLARLDDAAGIGLGSARESIFTKAAERGWTTAAGDLDRIGLSNANERITARQAWRGGREASQAAKAAGTGGRARALMSGARVAGSVALRGFGRAVPFLGWGLLVKDVAKFTTKTTGRVMKGFVDAGHSYVGGLSNPIMGAQFRDSDVSRTSRSRGVMEIQNSRLNARSILGAESGSMAAHFG